MRLYAFAAYMVLTTACAEESEPTPLIEPDPFEECEAPNRPVGGACIEPGVQDDGCPAGTLAAGDGSCVPAGTPAEQCADGFAHDGDVGCEPILPEAPCPSGLMAVPGDTRCRPV